MPLLLNVLFYVNVDSYIFSDMRSEIWRFFEEQRGVDNLKVRLCRLCDSNVVVKCGQGSTKGLWSHLENCHKDEFKSIKKRPNQILPNNLL